MAYQRRTDRGQASDSSDLLGTVRALSPAEFENWVADLLQAHYPSAKVHRVGASGDRGVDVVVHDGGGTLVVQCKRYAPRQLVGSREMQMFLGAMMHRRTERGAFVTTSGFTAEAKAIGDSHNVWLVDQTKLVALAAKYDPVIRERQQAEEEYRHHLEYQAWLRKEEQRRKKELEAATNYLRWQESKRAEDEARAKKAKRMEELERLRDGFATFFFFWAVILIAAGIYVNATVPTFGRHRNDLLTLLFVTAVLAASVLQLLISIVRRTSRKE